MSTETKTYTIQEAEKEALLRHPDCSFALVVNGMDCFFQLTWIVRLWRNSECFVDNDPPKYVEDGFPASYL